MDQITQLNKVPRGYQHNLEGPFPWNSPALTILNHDLIYKRISHCKLKGVITKVIPRTETSRLSITNVWLHIK